FLYSRAHLLIHLVLPDMLCVCAALTAHGFGILADRVPHICVEFAGTVFFLLPVHDAIHRRTTHRAFDKAGKNVSMFRAVSLFPLIGIQTPFYLRGLPEIVRDNSFMFAVKYFIFSLFDGMVLIACAFDFFAFPASVGDFS